MQTKFAVNEVSMVRWVKLVVSTLVPRQTEPALWRPR